MVLLKLYKLFMICFEWDLFVKLKRKSLGNKQAANVLGKRIKDTIAVINLKAKGGHGT